MWQAGRLAAALGVVAWHYWRLRKVLLRLTARQRLEPAQGRGVWNELDRLLFRGQAEMRTRKRRLLDMLRAYRDSRSLCAGCQAPRCSAVRR